MDIKLPEIELKAESSDYIENDLLICGKCHTPKQWRGKILGQECLMPCLCKCAEEKEMKHRVEEQEQRHAALIAARREIAFNGSPMMRWTFDCSDGRDTKLMHRAKKYVELFDQFFRDGKGLMLYGNTGTGKTFTACCIVNALIDVGRTARATNAAEIANELLGTWNKVEYMDSLMNCDILLLDDLGIERQTSYMAETLYNVVDGRYRNGKPIIVTTNLTAKQIREPDSMEQTRIYSRIKERCIALEVIGEDRRVQAALKNHADNIRMLDDNLKEVTK